jgi:dihydrofolate reductase
MTISLIWAMDDNRLIGSDNGLPWKLPADMKWFRQHTLGKPIVMGRKTYESFGARPLPQRTNIVITRDRDYRSAGAVIVHSIEEAIQQAGDADELMIIGGASFYQQMLPQADRLYITRVHGRFAGDTWFPDYNVDDWQEVEQHTHPADDRNSHDCTFIIYERKK